MEGNDVFPLLQLPKDILRYIMESSTLDFPSVRNLLVSCKTIYYTAPKGLRYKHLNLLHKLHHNQNSPPLSTSSRGDHRCPKCNERVKRLERHLNKCRGTRQCYICWKHIKVSNMYEHLHQGCVGPHVEYELPLLRDGRTHWKKPCPGESCGCCKFQIKCKHL